MRAIVASVGLLVLAALRTLPSQSRLPTDGGTTTSLGQPGPWLWTVGGAAGFRTEKGLVDGMGEARMGVSREILSRALGVGGLQAELYNQSLNAKYSAGARLRWVSQLTGVALGADYSLSDDELRPIITYVHPGKRGGLFGDGSVARLDVVIGPRHSITLGIEKPMFRRIPMGTTRPRDDVVTLPNAPRRASTPVPAISGLRDALATARDAARNIQQLCVPWLDHRGSGGARSDAAVLSRLEGLRRLTSATGANRNLDGETRRFHDAVDVAFAIASMITSAPAGRLEPAPTGSLAADSARRGRLVGERARAILLDEVILPYNRLLGQVKEKDSTLGYQVLARGAFVRWLHVESGLPAASAPAVMSVFDAVLDMVEESRAVSRREWDASRFVWLPLQYGLRAEQHDTQTELDAVVERATRREFTDGNSVSYVINEQFQNELFRTIHQARSYHVLWTHDFRGHNAKGEPDRMSYAHVLRSYLAALTARVREYDRTGTFPVYFILLDEWFYEVNDGRLWMDLLEDPTRHRVRLGSRYAAMEDALRVAQDSLRAAIAGSALLSSQRAQYGEAWLRDLVKVHVSITNATDPSFWSWHAVRGFPLPDTWMRDHRKLVFYDVSETDPSRGEAILTGAGVGEHYANPAWEDRSILVRGPAILPLKAAAREALIQQGIEVAEIPAVLQPAPGSHDHDIAGERETDGKRLRAMQLMNGTGFDAKHVNVAKAVLYTLMPAGSVIKIPDSLWNSTFWGSALVGCALRGVRVVVIAPSLENAPARAFGSMVRSRELLWRMVMASKVLGAEISSVGGLLKVGIYASTLPITDITGRLHATNRAMARHAWLRDLFQFPASMYSEMELLATSLAQATADSGDVNGVASDVASGSRPLLHLKANFFASREAWQVMERPEWAQVSSAFLRQRIAQVSSTFKRQGIAQLDGRPPALDSLAAQPDSALRASDDAVRLWYEGMPAATRDRVLFYTVLGSANQNDRSMVSDGEDALVLAGWPAVIPYLDLLTLVGQIEWIETPEELHALLPRQGRLQTILAHWFKFVF